MTEKKLVLYGDVVDSRKIKKRNRFEKNLKKSIKEINKYYNGSFESKLQIIKGIDELGGVLGRIDDIYNILIDLNEKIHKSEIRLVVVYDYIDIGFGKQNISEMDGEAFHKANKLLKEIKKQDFIFGLCLNRGEFDKILEGNINLLYFIRKDRTKKQNKAIDYYEEYEKQEKAALKLGIKQQSLSKLLQRARYSQIKKLEENLNSALEKISLL